MDKQEEKTVNLQFSLDSNNFNLLESDDYCSIAEVDFLHLGVNRNRCNITKECVEKSLQSFYNKPMLCILDNSFNAAWANDFTEHARSEEDRNNFIAFGVIPESSTFKLVERDNGKTYLNAKVVIWKNYFPIVMSILERRKSVKVSIELAVIDGEQDENTGILNINEFRLLSCVLLGEGVMEGIEGSHMDVIRFAYNQDEIDMANRYYLTFSNNHDRYKIPEHIQKEIKNGLDVYKNIGQGCMPQDVIYAMNLVNSKYINKTTIDKISQRFSKLNRETDGLTFGILGGKEMENWVNDMQESVGENQLKTVNNSLSTDELREKIWAELDKYTYRDGEWVGTKYYINEIYSDEKVIILRDNETAKIYKVPYTVENDNVSVDLEAKKEVKRVYEEKEYSLSNHDTAVFAKEDYGKGETITVDKSKEAMSDTSWGSVNKTELRKKVLDAKNYKSLVKDVYLVVEEGWEDAPSSKLKYPVMEIKDGKAVYNRYGLASALAYARQNNETAVVTKVESLYKKLDIEDDGKGGEKEMAKELDEEKKNAIVENKIDKDNKDVEKIKDDADAQEDDVKEKDKEEKEVKNANTNDDIGFADDNKDDKKEEEKPEDDNKEEKDDIKTNKIEKDDKGEEGLEDDVDSDKDYWKKKANSLEVENTAIKEELKKYKRDEEKREMAAEIDKFAHCMTEDECAELKSSIETCTMAEMKEKINEKVAGFALKMKEEQENKKEYQYSINPMFEVDTMKFSKETVNSLEDIINNSHVKIAGRE